MKKNILIAVSFFFTVTLLGQNKFVVNLRTGGTNVYRTDSIKSVDFITEDDFSVTMKNGTVKEFNETAKGISLYKKAIDGIVEIEETSGWFESGYIKWPLLEGAYSYNVYVKSAENGSIYSKLNSFLVRNYGTYGRADAPGLSVGRYLFKIVPVDSLKEEITENAAVSDTFVVKSYDRSGFAHLNYSGVGAYDDNGILKSGAKVLYVTKNNCNTVTLDVITDSKGGVTKGTGIGNILYLKQKGYDSTPWDIRIVGCITPNDINQDQLLSDENGLQLKANNQDIVYNVTIEGVGDDAVFNGFGMTFYKGCGAEMRNIGIMNHEDDAVQVKGTKHIWIHNCDIFYGNPGGDADQAKGDGSIDIKDNAGYATISYNHLVDDGKVSLCGMKSETGDNWICYHHNWFDHSDSRHPRVRTMTVHVWNNYYDGVAKYGIGATSGSNIFVENNYFRATKRPMMSSLQGTDAQGDGTFSGENGGMIKAYGNIYAEKPSSFSFITQNVSSISFDAYQASSRTEEVPSSYKTLVGGTPYNNFDTDNTLMYDYTPDSAKNIPEIVTGFWGAGRIGHGDFKWDFDNAVDDASYSVNTALKTALRTYNTSLVSVFGSADTTSSQGGSPGEGGSGNEGDPNVNISSKDTCYFTLSGPSNTAISVNGNMSDSHGSAVVNGVRYNICLKIESSTSVSFNLPENMTLTIVLGDTEIAASVNIKVDGVKASGMAGFTSSLNVMNIPLTSGSHTLTKVNSGYIFYMSFTK